MNLDPRTAVARISQVAKRGGALLARHFGRLGEARRRRVALEEEFYREFEGYCLANNLSPICVDDWWLRIRRQNDRSHDRRW
jgi:hypothetical protein